MSADLCLGASSGLETGSQGRKPHSHCLQGPQGLKGEAGKQTGLSNSGMARARSTANHGLDPAREPVREGFLEGVLPELRSGGGGGIREGVGRCRQGAACAGA